MKSARFLRMTGGAIAWMAIALSCLPITSYARESFWLAVQANDALAVRAELGRGINPNLLHPEFGPAIVVAAKDRAFDVVRLLASLDATQLDATNRSDETALMLVCMFGDIRTAQYLMDRGAQVNRPGWTPLHYAATGGHDRLVSVLLDRHAFIDAQSPNLTTPLMMAARMKFPSVVRLLIEEGADPTPRNQAGLDAAAYLQRAGLSADALWLKERAMQYILRYGTVEQPRRAEGGEPGQAAASAAATAAPASGSGAFSAVPLARESLVVDEAAGQSPRAGAAPAALPSTVPGKSPVSSGAVAGRPAATGAVGTATPASTGVPGATNASTARPAAKAAEPAQNRSTAAARGATPAQGIAAAKVPAAPAGVAPIAPAASVSSGSRSAGSATVPLAASASGPAPFMPAPVTPVVPAAPAAPINASAAAPPTRATAPVLPVAPIAPVQPVEPEPVFVSRTLALPEEPAAAGPASAPRIEPRAR